MTFIPGCICTVQILHSMASQLVRVQLDLDDLLIEDVSVDDLSARRVGCSDLSQPVSAVVCVRACVRSCVTR